MLNDDPFTSFVLALAKLLVTSRYEAFWGSVSVQKTMQSYFRGKSAPVGSHRVARMRTVLGATHAEQHVAPREFEPRSRTTRVHFVAAPEHEGRYKLVELALRM